MNKVPGFRTRECLTSISCSLTNPLSVVKSFSQPATNDRMSGHLFRGPTSFACYCLFRCPDALPRQTWTSHYLHETRHQESHKTASLAYGPFLTLQRGPTRINLCLCKRDRIGPARSNQIKAWLRALICFCLFFFAQHLV